MNRRCLIERTISQKEYKQAKAQQEEKEDNVWYSSFPFRLGFGGAAIVGTAIALGSAERVARRNHDPILRESNRAFHRSSEAFASLREYMGIGTAIHQSVLNTLQHRIASIHAAARRARSHRNHPLRLWHLFINAFD